MEINFFFILGIFRKKYWDVFFQCKIGTVGPNTSQLLLKKKKKPCTSWQNKIQDNLSEGSLCGWRSFTSTCWLWLMACLAETSCCGVTLPPWQAGKWEASMCLTNSVPQETAACLSPHPCPDPSFCSDPQTNRPPCCCAPPSPWRGPLWQATTSAPPALPSLMASCLMREWWHNWLSNLRNVFGIFSHASCIAPGMALSGWLSFHHSGAVWRISRSLGWIAVKWCADAHVFQRKCPNDFGDHHEIHSRYL